MRPAGSKPVGPLAALAARLRAVLTGTPALPAETGTEHDFTRARKGWVHTAGRFGADRWTGFGRGIRPGDVLLTDNVSGKVGRWLVLSVEYMRDPSDQWFATVELVGYKA